MFVVGSHLRCLLLVLVLRCLLLVLALLERHISSNVDNCDTSREHLSGNVGSPSSFDLTIGIALLIGILENNVETLYCMSFCSRGYFKICDFADDILTIDDMVIVETYQKC